MISNKLNKREVKEEKKMQKKHKKQKKGAFELSMTTVVIIVLAMVLLILGLTLIRRIMGTGFNVIDITDKKTMDAINKFLTVGEQEELQFYLPANTAEIPQGETFGIAFRFSPEETAAYSYKTEVSEVSGLTCPKTITPAKAEAQIVLGKSGKLGTINSGDNKLGLIKINMPKTYPLGCEIRYLVTVSGGGITESEAFDVRVVRKRVMGVF